MLRFQISNSIDKKIPPYSKMFHSQSISDESYCMDELFLILGDSSLRSEIGNAFDSKIILNNFN